MTSPVFPGYNPGLGAKYPFGPAYVRDRAPTITDLKDQSGYYPIPSLWVHFKDNNPTDSDIYALVSLDSNVATWVLLGTATGMSTELQGDDGDTTVPDGSGIIYLVGSAVAQGANAKPIFFDGIQPNANSMTLEIQYAGNPASSQATAVGLASFDSSIFSVDSVGFVTLLNGLYSAEFEPDFGANVVPNGSSVVAISGQVVASGTTPIQTSNGGANQMNIDIQRADVGTAGNPNLCGISYFNSSEFTITADGFVSLSGGGGGGIADIETDDGAPNVVPSGGSIQILGGTGIVTSGQGPGNTVTIDATGLAAFTWTEVSVNTNMAVNTGYITNAAGSIDLLLPAVASVGDEIRITRKGAGAFVVTQGAGQTVHFGSSSTTTGAGGSITSLNQYDSLHLVCITANTDFVVLSSQGAGYTIV